jgi:glutathione S-transferase
MADVTIYGVPQSTFTRTCCMTCEEKGIGYERLDAAPHSPEILAYNPTGKIPRLPTRRSGLVGERRDFPLPR